MRSWSKLTAISILALIMLVGCSQQAAPITAVPKGAAATPTVADASPAAKGSEPAKPASPNASGASGANADAMARYDVLVQAAKKEGKVTVSNSQVLVRDPLKETFGQKYGIDVEFWNMTPAALLSRLQTERQAGQYNLDILLSGITTFTDSYIPAKLIDPLDEVLILPEVTDTSKWLDGKLPWVDPGRMVFRFNKYVSPYISINTKVVGKDEIKSYKDLLDPKWKGKIVAHDPTVPGAGAIAGSFLMLTYGEDFVRQLYIAQEPVFSEDIRQIADWNALGRYPVALWGVEPAQLQQMQDQGLPVDAVVPSDIGSVAGGWGLMAMINKPPHPNAARLLANWLASKEGQEMFAKVSGRPVTRVDVDQSFLPDYLKLKPGVQYMDTFDYDYAVNKRIAAEKRLQDVVKR